MLVENIMFSLIRGELLGSPVDEHIKNELTEEKYIELYRISVKHDLSHIVASALSRLRFLGDDEISANFHKNLMISSYRDVQREYAINLTQDLLEKAHIPHIPLKGSVLRHLYPQTWMRTSCDIDILIRKSDADLVESVLCSEKYIRFGDSSTHDYNFMSPNRIHVEMHHTLTQEGKLSSTDDLLESVWESYSVLDDGYQYRYSMTPELFIIYHLAHMARHLLCGGCGVRPFLDLWLIDKHFSCDSKKLNKLLAKCRLEKLYDISKNLGKVWLEEYQHSKETEQLERYVLSGGAYGTTVNAAKIKAANGVGRVRSFMGLMILPRKNLQVLYPKLESHPILFPFYQVKRWFRIFDKNKRERIKRLTDQRKEVTTEEADSVGVLLRHLGLAKE